MAEITVEHSVAVGGTDEYDRQGGSATRVYHCDGENADALASELLGVIAPEGEFQSWSVPHQHPLRPHLYCQKVSVKGLGTPRDYRYGGTSTPSPTTAPQEKYVVAELTA